MRLKQVYACTRGTAPLSSRSNARRPRAVALSAARHRDVPRQPAEPPSRWFQMDAAFEAVLREDVEISTCSGNVRLARGTYIVTAKRDQRGTPDGARLCRIDVSGEIAVRLTQAEYEVVDARSCFTRRTRGRNRAV